ncbi:polysaccharide biosynthesis protein [Bacillus clarus]|uniref:Polysaccharide biosynthesis family protein n=1 Tax=Bacillus clarus TaxID=2338372 RepID=A0A090YTD3_9BACI|nr:polysaccharide biosynthesis protein [Bacillus clarus]KFN02089.1 polysaccharide biosynthesis family protein [Bacillus clarus]RFT63982.1 polysaccharide biosynthesis protein [Bacillus clarus]
MEAKKYQAFWRGAIILTIASFVTKVLSAFYRIPYQNIAGDVGFYIYQQIYPFYGFCLILTTYGFPIIISKMVAERLERGKQKEAEEIICVSFWFLLGIGFIGFFTLFFGAKIIALAMGDVHLDKLLRVISFSFLLMPFLSVARGYFQGFNNMMPTAVSQVIEQTIRVSIIVFLSLFLIAHSFDLYTVGAGAMLGSIAGGLIGIIVLLLYMRHDFRSIFSRGWRGVKHKKKIIRILFWQGIAICISNLVLIFIQMADSVSFYSLLIRVGEQPEVAKVLKGVYDRSIPLMQLGTVVTTSFSLSLIPIITGAKERGDLAFIREKVQLAMKITIVIGFAASIGLACIMKPTNIMLFENSDGSGVLAILSISILFSALSITTASILQGLGETLKPALFVVLGGCLKLALNYILMPHFGVTGAAIATLVALIMIAVFNSVLLIRIVGEPLFSKKNVLGVMASGLGMAFILKVFMRVFQISGLPIEAEYRGMATTEALLGVLIGGLVYVFLILKFQVFTKEELGTFMKEEKKEGSLKKSG